MSDNNEILNLLKSIDKRLDRLENIERKINVTGQISGEDLLLVMKVYGRDSEKTKEFSNKIREVIKPFRDDLHFEA